ncbi:DUF3575 domain-containing protein [Faecalibacter bovis]|uniref:DUF3575 domain-containing protein n=1 Tax=Faecalibacter bovis TaxID=2898187 RepID=A0ABX7XEM9_9FLAO|nr:DUF3575 domain-containing protein [Faecalibacter bovis]QTV06350.1 DUF3575 domain-containing protein [Faecalibacter bovis]
MKKTFFTLLLSSTIFAQEKATDLKSIHINVIGIGASYEKALADNFTVLGNINYSTINFRGTNDSLDMDLTIKLGLEGRYYYNFDRRLSKGKSTLNNSGNYVGLKIDYYTDWLSTYEGIGKDDDFVKLVANYGIKRNFGKQFYYEFNTGLGLIVDSYHSYKYSDDGGVNWIYSDKKTELSFLPEVGFRVGYNF